MKTNEIIPGDIVIVSFNQSESTLCNEAEVLNVPHQTGESWIFKDTKLGWLHYVSEGCTVSKKLTPPPKSD